MGVTFNADTITIAAYVFYNLVYAACFLSDGNAWQISSALKNYSAGFVLFAIVYGGFAFNPSIAVIFILFFVYGIYAAATEGVIKAWITNFAHKENTATAIGFYTILRKYLHFIGQYYCRCIMDILSAAFILLLSTAVIAIIVSFIFLLKDQRQIKS